MPIQVPLADPTGQPVPTGRALVVVGRPARSRPEERPLAGFLAQLIACERRLPAYRPARTADPEIAASRYRIPDRAPAVRLDRDA